LQVIMAERRPPQLPFAAVRDLLGILRALWLSTGRVNRNGDASPVCNALLQV
jgi:hypothetical protein